MIRFHQPRKPLITCAGAILALSLLAGCQDQPAELGPDAPAQPQGGGSAAEMGPTFCQTPPTDPTYQNEWNQMCMPGR